MMKIDPYKSVRAKVNRIFSELVGDRSKQLDDVAYASRNAIEDAMKKKWGMKRARSIAFHITDWNYDAAFLVALHLFPEKFTKKEIEAGIGLFSCHVPNHIGALACLLEEPMLDSFEHEVE
jgi:hypothetical protein